MPPWRGNGQSDLWRRSYIANPTPKFVRGEATGLFGTINEPLNTSKDPPCFYYNIIYVPQLEIPARVAGRGELGWSSPSELRVWSCVVVIGLPASERDADLVE